MSLNNFRHIFALILALLWISASAQTVRDSRETHRFRKANPCPVTGKITGACPGWEIDHIVPLCAGGPDKAANLQWLTREAHAAKTRRDVQGCRRNSRGELR